MFELSELKHDAHLDLSCYLTALRQNTLSLAMLQSDSVNTEQTATLSHTSQLHASRPNDQRA